MKNITDSVPHFQLLLSGQEDTSAYTIDAKKCSHTDHNLPDLSRVETYDGKVCGFAIWM